MNMLDKEFDKFFIGFDTMMNRVNESTKAFQKITNYPPYNIKKLSDNSYLIEMAVAGFAKQDIEIDLQDSKLVIKGSSKLSETDYDSCHMLYGGLAMRPFTKLFELADNVKVLNANLMNGILKVYLESIIPESKKAQKININDGEVAATSKEFLRELNEGFSPSS